MDPFLKKRVHTPKKLSQKESFKFDQISQFLLSNSVQSINFFVCAQTEWYSRKQWGPCPFCSTDAFFCEPFLKERKVASDRKPKTSPRSQKLPQRKVLEIDKKGMLLLSNSVSS